jgi:uncharacterized protein involved in outer membrane biogenesis
MALSRKAKIWLVILSIPVLLIIAGVVALKVLFTSERLKAFLIPKIEEATHRTVTVSDISLSIFPSLAIEIDTLKVSNISGEGFSERPFLALDRLVLDVKLFPLLKGSLEVPNVLVEQPVILLEINEEGLTNYAPVPEEEDTGHVRVRVTMEGGEFLLSNLQIVNGAVEYYDKEENTAIRLEGIQQSTRIHGEPVMREVRLWTESSVENFSYGTLASNLVSGLRLTSKGELLYREQDDRLTIEQGEGTVQDIVLNIKGSVENVSTAPFMNIILESDKAGIPDLLSLAPPEYMKKAEGLQGTGTAKVNITVSGIISDTTKPDVHGVISATNATIRYGSLPKPITDVYIVCDFTKTMKKQEFRITKFAARLGDNPLSATMTIVNFEDPSLTLSLSASLNLGEVKEYYPVEAGTELSGRLNANVNIAGKVNNQKSMKASGSMVFQNVTVKSATSSTPLRNLNGTIAFNNQLVESKKLSMNIGKSDLSFAFALRNYLSIISEAKGGSRPTATLSLSSSRLFTKDLISEDQKSASTGKQPAKKSGLPLPGIDMDVTASIGTLTMEKFELTNVRASLRISEGLVTLQNFTCNTYNGTITTKGTLGLQNPDRPVFDLTFDMSNIDAHAMLPEFTSFGKRFYGKLNMDTALKGELNDTLGLVTSALSGTGRVQVQSGKLEGFKVNQSLASMLNLPSLEMVSFKDWANTFTISNGRMVMKDLKISALNAEYIVNGAFGLDGSLDYTMTLLLPPETSSKITLPGFAGQAVDLFKDPSGRVKLDFSVTGTSDNPKLSLETSAAKKKAEELAKQKLEAEKKKLEEQLKKKAEDLLKDIDPFKKKK